MSVVSMESIQKLREASGAGMMDCKKALTETAGDIDAAMDWLRKKGIASAAKKAYRIAAEGLVAAVTNGTKGLLLEVNCETDFVGKNADFQALVTAIAEEALAQGISDVEQIKNLTVNGTTAQEALTTLIAKIGENMSLRRASVTQVSQGVIVSYLHNAVSPKAGRIGVLVSLESTAPEEKLNALGRQIAMHIAAARPDALDRLAVDASKLEREKSVLVEQARASGKPENIIEKMVEGRINKFYEEIVLLEQAFVMNPDLKVADHIDATAKELGAPVKLVAFERFTVGEGIEKQSGDFAAEVAKMAK
ncbi:MAG: elongation factor Ts [Alphaproteobacteria bacterium]|nr:elongation factor Ts [Alphaproteobacteria bacterium]